MKLVMMFPASDCPPLAFPLFADRASCGFPSPAQDYVEQELDLNDLLSPRKRGQYGGWQSFQR
jgi:DNA polymerase V